MKQGKTLTELAMEIERQHTAKRDLVAPGAALTMNPDATMHLGALGNLPIGEIAHGQIADKLGIPVRYYNRMLAEHPQLLSVNANEWLAKAPDQRHMVRTLDGRMRAFLSDSYRPLEHIDLAEAVLPVLLGQNLEIMSCEVTERRLYIKAVDQRIKADVPAGRKIGDGSHVFFDTCSPAITISNSEVGFGRLSIEYGVYTKVCTNLATLSSGGMKKTHVGARNAITDDLQVALSDEARRASDRAVWLAVRDTVLAAFDAARFEADVAKLRGLAEQPITTPVVEFINLSAKRFGLSETEGQGILHHLIQGGDLTRYGFFNAVTRTAQDLPSYDRASEFEQLGGTIVELPRHDWERLAMAA